jgi:DNA polymerase sigma
MAHYINYRRQVCFIGHVNNSNIRFSDEIASICEYFSLWEDDMTNYDATLTKVRNLICLLDPSSVVTVFGSYATGLALVSSDIDIHVKTNDCLGFLYKLQDRLLASDFVFDVKVINAKTPICRFQTTNNILFDVSANPMLNVQGHIDLMNSYLSLYPHMKNICLWIKVLLKQYQMSEVHKGGLSSNTVQYMVISHLQNYESNFGTKWEETALGVLLMDFLYLYGHVFDFETVSLRIESGYELYDRTSSMCVWDALSKDHNVAAGSYNVHDVKELFRASYDYLKDKLKEGYDSACTGLIAPRL